MIKWSDIHQNVELDGQGNIKMAINVDAVKTSIFQILHTRRGSRIMHPTFGSDIHGMVFDKITPDLGRMIANEIKTDVEMWDPRVSITNIGVISDPDTHQTVAEINFTINGYDESFLQSVPLN